MWGGLFQALGTLGELISLIDAHNIYSLPLAIKRMVRSVRRAPAPRYTPPGTATPSPPGREDLRAHGPCTVPDICRRHPRRVGRRPGPRDVAAPGTAYQRGELRTLVYRLARALAALGVSRGTTVTLLAGNRPETLAVRYAAHLLGCRVTHLYSKLSAKIQAAIVEDVETRVLVTDPDHQDRAAELAAYVPMETVLCFGPGHTGGIDLLSLAERESGEPLAARAEPDDIGTIRHTGGTTGRPKGICLSHSSLRALGPTQQAHGHVSTQRSPIMADAPRLLVGTTLAHLGGTLADLALRTGGSVVLLPDFDAAQVLDTIERERVTDLFLLPPLLYALTDEAWARPRDTSSLRSLVYGGCQSSPVRLAQAVEVFGPILVQFYGQNEAGGVSVLPAEAHDPAHPARMRTAGQPLPGVEVIVRNEDGNMLPPGALGEICVRTGTMQGYWKQPELTAEVLRGGWLHTGDLGFLDKEGYLTIVDRLKDMIVVVGGHVYTADLEDALNAHPDVRASAALGVRDGDRTEQVCAAVVPSDPAHANPDRLADWVEARLGSMYRPHHIVFTDAIPLTDAGKPDKKQLRHHLA